MDFTITKREILVCIAITLLLIGIGFLTSSAIKNVEYENNEKYHKSLKIDNDEDTFKYALKTNVGYVLVNGNVKTEGISIDGINGKYFYIKKVKERYTEHTRQVAHTRTVSDGKGGTKTETYYTTETYWEWDYVSSEEKHVDKFTFSGVEFDYNTIKFYNNKHIDTIKESSKIRYKYYAIPTEFNGTLFTFIENNTITQNEFSVELSLQDTLKSKTSSIGTLVFWIIWVIIIGLLDFGYVYMDNKYLED